jgi:hypothetical protein
MSSFKDKLTAYRATQKPKSAKVSVCIQKQRSEEINKMLMNLAWLNDADIYVIMKEYNTAYIKSKECGEDGEKFHIGIICDILENMD